MLYLLAEVTRTGSRAAQTFLKVKTSLNHSLSAKSSAGAIPDRLLSPLLLISIGSQQDEKQEQEQEQEADLDLRLFLEENSRFGEFSRFRWRIENLRHQVSSKIGWESIYDQSSDDLRALL